MQTYANPSDKAHVLKWFNKYYEKSIQLPYPH